MCGTSLCQGVPIMQAFYHQLKKLGTNKSKWSEMLMCNSGVRFLIRGDLRGETEITPEARYDCWKAWGLLPDLQVALEKLYSQMSIEYTSETYANYADIPFLQL